MTDTGFSRPALNELIQRIEADYNTRLPGADSRVRRSALSVIARSEAGAVHSLYGYLDFLAKQLFVDTATGAYLRRHAAIWEITPKEATKATGTVTITGTNGSHINIGTILRRGDGVEYEITEAVTISGGTATADLRAVEAGETGNADADTTLTFISPISGVNSTGTSSELASGTDAEADDALRARVLEQIQNPPHGGSESDYIRWAKEVAGVTRAWVSNELGVSSVLIRFMMDDTYDDGIPLAADVAAVLAYINDASRRNVTAEIFVEAPTASPIDFTIALKKADGTTEDDPDVEAAVEAELADMIRRDAEPGGKILISHIREAISIAAGEHDHVITTPNADVTHSADEIATMGTVTFS